MWRAFGSEGFEHAQLDPDGAGQIFEFHTDRVVVHECEVSLWEHEGRWQNEGMRFEPTQATNLDPLYERRGPLLGVCGITDWIGSDLFFYPSDTGSLIVMTAGDGSDDSEPSVRSEYAVPSYVDFELDANGETLTATRGELKLVLRRDP